MANGNNQNGNGNNQKNGWLKRSARKARDYAKKKALEEYEQLKAGREARKKAYKAAYIKEKARKGRMQARRRVRGYEGKAPKYAKTFKTRKKTTKKKKKPINYMANPFGKDAFKF
jgi:hypothetical protein